MRLNANEGLVGNHYGNPYHTVIGWHDRLQRRALDFGFRPLRRDSSEGLPAALTRPRNHAALLIFGCILMEFTQHRTVGTLKRLTIVGDGSGDGGQPRLGGVLPYSVASRRLDHVRVADSDATHMAY